MTDDLSIEIKGGAGPYEAAAIAAAISASLAEDDRGRSRLPRDRRAPAWVRLGTAQPFARFVPPVVPDPGRNWPA